MHRVGKQRGGPRVAPSSSQPLQPGGAAWGARGRAPPGAGQQWPLQYRSPGSQAEARKHPAVAALRLRLKALSCPLPQWSAGIPPGTARR